MNFPSDELKPRRCKVYYLLGPQRKLTNMKLNVMARRGGKVSFRRAAIAVLNSVEASQVIVTEVVRLPFRYNKGDA